MNLKDKFLSAVNEFLKVNAFIKHKNDPAFVKCNGDNGPITYILNLNISSKGLSYDFVVELFIRHEEFVKIRKKFTGLKYKGDCYYTVISRQSSLADLYQLSEYKTLGYFIKDEETSHSSIDNFKSFMIDIGFPFFERFKTIADFDKWFSEPVLNGTYDFKCGYILNFAVEGLIAAKLNNSPNYEKIYEIWMKSISPDYTQALETVKVLKVYLDNYGSNS